MSKTKLFIWFMGLMGKYLPRYLMAIFISSFGLAFARVANAWIVEDIIHSAQTGKAEGLLWTVVWNFSLFVLAQFTWRFGIIRYNIEGKRGIARLEKRVFTKAIRLPYAYYEEHHSADFMSKLIFDTERAGDIYGSRLRRLVAAILSTIIYLVPMLLLGWQLTLCLVMVGLVALVVNSLFTAPMKEAGATLSQNHSIMLEKLTNILAGMEMVKIFPVGKHLLHDYDIANDDYYKTQMKTGKLSAALDSLNNFLDLMGSLIFLGLGIWFVSKSKITLGALTAIYTLYGSFRYSLLEIGKYLPQMMNCLANVERIHTFLQMEEEDDTASDKAFTKQDFEKEPFSFPDTNANIVFGVKGLSFSYSNETQEKDRKYRKLLEDFSLLVEEGSSVALVGESGCGKSTLAKLILGFYQPRKGMLYICGKNYRDCSLQQIRIGISQNL